MRPTWNAEARREKEVVTLKVPSVTTSGILQVHERHLLPPDKAWAVGRLAVKAWVLHAEEQVDQDLQRVAEEAQKFAAHKLLIGQIARRMSALDQQAAQAVEKN